MVGDPEPGNPEFRDAALREQLARPDCHADQEVTQWLDFERLSGKLEEALAYTSGAHSLDTVWAGIEKGTLQFWPFQQSFLITELHLSPTGLKTLHFFLGGGSLDELKLLQPLVLEWGKTQGAEAATFTGRRGWERTFLTRESGWQPTHTLFRKAL